jgi:hypothetical protein
MSEDNGDDHKPRERKDPPKIDGMFTLKVDNVSHRVT